MYEFVTTCCLYTCKTFKQNLAKVADITNIHIFGFFSCTVQYTSSLRHWTMNRVLNDLYVEDQVFCRGRMIWLLPSPVRKRDRQHTGKLRMRDNFLMVVEGGRGGRGAESNDRKKAWVSKNHTILSHSL